MAMEDRVRDLMMLRHNIRNMSVIAHVDHGKTTLTDSLLSKAGLIAAGQAGDKCHTDNTKMEQERGITIKSTAISLPFELSEHEMGYFGADVTTEGRGFLVNLIDCPGHVDFSSEVTAALRVTDGAMVVVDCVSGVSVQTETVLRQALQERVRPVLMMNKLDRCIMEKQQDPEDLYQSLIRVIAKVNSVIDTYADDTVLGMQLDPARGNVAFGSGLHGWGFTLRQMALVYAKHLGVDEHKLVEKLWGENFYNPQTRKWSKKPGDGAIRGFNKFVLEPIYKVLKETTEQNLEEVTRLVERLGVKLPTEELARVTTGRDLMRAVMRRWLPAGDAMVQIILLHLPSPVVAQRYRAELLYEGPMDDEVAQAIMTCDPTGPLMLYVSKMVPTNDKGRFYAYGRVFSGTVSSRQKVLVLAPGYKPGQETPREATLSRVVMLMSGKVISVGTVPCGNCVALGGVDNILLKTGTLTTYEHAHNMRVLKFSVSPVVRVAVEVTKAADLPKLLEGLRRLAKSDPMVQCSSENGQHIVAGAGELHLEVCLHDLQETHAGVPIKRSDPVVSYLETVTTESSQICLAKSNNKHNRLYISAHAMAEELVEDIEEGVVCPNQDSKVRARQLVDKYGFDVNEARKLWSFGPDGTGPNLLTDGCRGVQNVADAKDMVMAGFQWASKEGPLCEERMRGVHFRLEDAMIHSDPAQRKGGQLIPAARRALYGAFLTAQPRLMEPVYMVEVQCPSTCIGGIHATLNPRRGHVFEESVMEGTPLYIIKGYLPVNESFGFTDALRAATSGQAFPQCLFDHWQVVPGDPWDPETKAGLLVRDVRMRKGLNPAVPAPDYYIDRL